MRTVKNLQHASSDDDLLPVVNDNDEVIGVSSRREVHLKGLLHRAIQVSLVTPDGRVWLQKRSAAKDTWPGAWDMACSGHVDPGETYEQAARRELAEELGLTAEPVLLYRNRASEATGWEFQACYWLRWAGTIEAFNREEIDQMRPFTLDEIMTSLENPDKARWLLTPGVGQTLPRLAEAAGLSRLSSNSSSGTA